MKKLIPEKVIITMWQMKLKLDATLVRVCSKGAFLSSVYFLFFSKEFRREHQSVLLGRVAYKKSTKQISDSSYLLRRNTHRLEKGLIMKPRRPIFALNYIEETVNCYAIAALSSDFCRDEAKWASDVLSEYFSVIEHTQFTKALEQKFQRSHAQLYDNMNTSSDKDVSYIPYPSNSVPGLEVTEGALHALFMRRRSTRWFKPEPAPMAAIMKAIDMASTAPSACNRQPFHFKICSQPETAQSVARLAMGTSGFAENIQSLIVVVGDLSAYPFERDRHCIYIDASLASMQFMLAAETLGLSTCPINWPDIDSRERAMQKALSLPRHLRPVMLIAVGYADANGGIAYSQKKSSAILAKTVDA